MTSAELQNRMGRLRVEELVRIADSDAEEGFEFEVIRAAQDELALRGVASADLAALQHEAHVLRSETTTAAEKSLSTAILIVFVIVGPFLIFSIFGILLFIALRTRGYNRMAREAFNASAAGLIVWFCAFALIAGAAWLFGW